MAEDSNVAAPGIPDDSSGHGSCLPFGLPARLIENPVMVAAYAISLVVLACGLIALVITIAVLSFFYPDKANAFVVLLGGPIAALLVLHSRGAKQVTVKLLNGKSDTTK